MSEWGLPVLESRFIPRGVVMLSGIKPLHDLTATNPDDLGATALLVHPDEWSLLPYKRERFAEALRRLTLARL